MNNKRLVFFIITLGLLGSNLCLAMTETEEGYVMVGEEDMPTPEAPTPLQKEMPGQEQMPARTIAEPKMGRAQQLTMQRSMPVAEPMIEDVEEEDIIEVPASEMPMPESKMGGEEVTQEIVETNVTQPMSAKRGRLQQWREAQGAMQGK